MPAVIQGRGPGRPPVLTEGTVRLIVRRAAKGKRASDIARELDNRGVKTAHGAPAWSSNTVRSVLKSKRALAIQAELER